MFYEHDTLIQSKMGTVSLSRMNLPLFVIDIVNNF